MRLSKTLSHLARVRRAADKVAAAPRASGSGRLTPLSGLVDNPGNLNAFSYVPQGLAAGAPLVVVLHGCTQNAAGYDHGSGWSHLAERHGFALLFPEQQRANNSNLCFNWYEPTDNAAGRGEAASIRHMIDRMAQAHQIDRERVFVTGLSAGGAMASVMLAAYPDMFAGGAIVAGLPFGCASNLSEAFGCMAGRGHGGRAALAAKVRAASSHGGPWPRVSVWHGAADGIVVPGNGDAIAAQWAEMHGLPTEPSRVEKIGGHSRSVWTNAAGEELVEHYSLAGMAHGTPLKPGKGDGRSGVAGAHMIDVGLSSTDHIAAFFGILSARPAARVKPAKAVVARPAVKPAVRAERRPREAPRAKLAPAAPPVSGVQKVIEDALRAAGLMR
jgi:poly(hydroxyalkanoate) depolymerase family esterase